MRMTEREFVRAFGKKPPGSKSSAKYNSQKTLLDGITFDSRKEADKYAVLKLQKQAGEVLDFKLQPKFLLQEGFTDRNGVKHREIIYRADFWIKYKDGREVVIDTKGYRTKEYLLKRKLFLKRYPDIVFVEE